MLSKIIAYAVKAHADTNHMYGDGVPYSVHLAMVAYFAQKHNFTFGDQTLEDHLLPACWLHDTIEDCRKTYNDIKEVAGIGVAEIVYALTNEKGKNRAARGNAIYYRGICITPGATFVKLCDRLANAKYSLDTNSKMLDVYRKENSKFITNLSDTPNFFLYEKMVTELKAILL